jgi:hypothetical protein
MRSPGEAAREGVAGVWWCVVYERRSSSTTIHLYHTTIHHPPSSIRTEVPPIQKLFLSTAVLPAGLCMHIIRTAKVRLLSTASSYKLGRLEGEVLPV